MPPSPRKTKINSVKTKTEVKEDRQKLHIPWVVSAIIILIIVFFASYYFFKSWGTIQYQGLSFTKERYQGFNNVIFYHYTHFFKYSDGQIYKSNVYFRIDPRKNKIPTEGILKFPANKTVYVGIENEQLRMCNDSQIAIGELGSFYNSHLMILKSGTPNPEEAIALNRTLITCETYPGEPTMIIKAGEKTIVSQTGSCQTISVSNCEILPAIEKSLVEALIELRGRTK